MSIAVWIVSGLLAAAYLAAGVMKSTQPKEKLAASLPWTGDFSPAAIKFIGITEFLGALGLVLPWLTGIAPVLTPIAATGLALIQALAIIVHVRRREPNALPINLVLLIAAAFVAIVRFAAL
jgi:uncharacterized membrane protein